MTEPTTPSVPKCGHSNRCEAQGRERVQLRYGSAPTEICIDCGSYRTLDRWASDWTPGPVPAWEDDE